MTRARAKTWTAQWTKAHKAGPPLYPGGIHHKAFVRPNFPTIIRQELPKSDRFYRNLNTADFENQAYEKYMLNTAAIISKARDNKIDYITSVISEKAVPYLNHIKSATSSVSHQLSVKPQSLHMASSIIISGMRKYEKCQDISADHLLELNKKALPQLSYINTNNSDFRWGIPLFRSSQQLKSAIMSSMTIDIKAAENIKQLNNKNKNIQHEKFKGSSAISVINNKPKIGYINKLFRQSNFSSLKWRRENKEYDGSYGYVSSTSNIIRSLELNDIVFTRHRWRTAANSYWQLHRNKKYLPNKNGYMVKNKKFNIIKNDEQGV